MEFIDRKWVGDWLTVDAHRYNVTDEFGDLFFCRCGNCAANIDEKFIKNAFVKCRRCIDAPLTNLDKMFDLFDRCMKNDQLIHVNAFTRFILCPTLLGSAIVFALGNIHRCYHSIIASLKTENHLHIINWISRFFKCLSVRQYCDAVNKQTDNDSFIIRFIFAFDWSRFRINRIFYLKRAKKWTLRRRLKLKAFTPVANDTFVYVRFQINIIAKYLTHTHTTYFLSTACQTRKRHNFHFKHSQCTCCGRSSDDSPLFMQIHCINQVFSFILYLSLIISIN